MKLNEAINKAVKMGKDSHGFRPRSWQGSGVYFTAVDDNVVEKVLVGMGVIGIGMDPELIEHTSSWESVSIQRVKEEEVIVFDDLDDEAETPRALIERIAEFSSPDSGALQSLRFADELEAKGVRPAFYVKDSTITVAPRLFNEP